MDENPVKVVLDTNVIISALGFGGKPREIFQLVLEKKIVSVTSPILLAELEDVIVKKFPPLRKILDRILKIFKKKSQIVKPVITIDILNDHSDNRVLEAAISGDCKYIITGDNELLRLSNYQNILIVTPDEFLRLIVQKS